MTERGPKGRGDRLMDNTELSPLWCANDKHHGEHSAFNEFGGVNYCTGRPRVKEPLMTTDLRKLIAELRPLAETFGDKTAFGRAFMALSSLLEKIEGPGFESAIERVIVSKYRILQLGLSSEVSESLDAYLLGEGQSNG